MTIANSLIRLALRSSGVVGVGQTPLADDVSDSLVVLNDMIGNWVRQRATLVIPGTLDTFPDLFTDVPSWTGKENVLLTSLTVRLASLYGMPADDLKVKLAESAIQLLQSNNQHQVPPRHPGVPTTCLQILFLALRMAGRITDQQSVADDSKDVDDAMSMLVGMLSQWQRRRWLVPALTDAVVPSTGAATYTVGPGADLDMPRPDRIEAAFVRMTNVAAPNRFDYPLTIVQAREDWNQVGLKNLQTLPSLLFYDAAFPVGALHVWPVPAAGAVELHVSVKGALPVYTSPASPFGLPPEYQEAVISNLACRIVALTGAQPPDWLERHAGAALDVISTANLQLATLSMPPGLSGRRAGGTSAALLSGRW